MTYKIEKGVPMPAAVDTAGEVLAKMEVGDSVLDEEPKTSRVQSRWYGAARRHDFTVTIKKLAVGHRIWRTK